MEQTKIKTPYANGYVRMPSTSNSLWYDATSTCLYSKDLMNDGTCGCSRPNSCVRKKKTARRTSSRHRIKMPRSRQLAIPQRNRHGRASARSAEGLAKP